MSAQPTRRRYDPAKTPLQRLLLSRVLSPAKERELLAVTQVLDPVRLLHQIERLQHALFRCAVNASPFSQHQSVTPIQMFDCEHCLKGSLPQLSHVSQQQAAGSAIGGTDEHDLSVENLLDWKRYRANPFEGEWDFIASCVREHPDLTVASLFRQLQSRSPGRYHPGQLRCLQRGVRLIRTRLLARRAEKGPAELIHGDLPEPALPSFPPTRTQETPAPATSGADSSGTEAMRAAPVRQRGGRRPNATASRRSDGTPMTPVPPPGDGEISSSEQDIPRPQESPLDHAIQAYLQEQAEAGRRPKTLQWHQTALGQLRAYLHMHQQSQDLDTLTDAIVQEWLTCLQTTPTSTGALRSSMTITTYARSVRAFGNWLVRTSGQAHALFSTQWCPTPYPKPVRVVEPEVFVQLLETCQRSSEAGASGDEIAARNQALLWLLWDGGLRVAELCALQRDDVFPQQGIVRIRGTGVRERRIALGPEGQQALRAYLDLTRGDRQERKDEEALFQTDAGTPLTINGLQSLFVRLNQRRNLPGTHINPSVLRDTFAVRSLRAGDSPEALQQLLGLAEKSALKRYQEEARSLAQEAPAPGSLKGSRA